MSRQFDEEMVHFEKRAVNQKGLLVILLIAIAIFGVGGYLLYKNRDKFDWTLPWEKEEEQYEVLGDKTGTNSTIEKNPNSNVKLIAPTLSSEIFNRNNTNLSFRDLKADDKGYTFTVDFVTFEGTVTLNIEKILIDGHDTSATLTISDTKDVGGKREQQATSATIQILKTELDALNIICFKKMTVFYRLTGDQDGKILNRADVNAFSGMDFNNITKGLIEMSTGNNISVRYYRTLTDKDYTYIYFDFLSQERIKSKTIKIKKLLINDELYEYKDLNESIYASAEKIFYIAIPRKDIKDVKKFTISFFILEQDGDSINAAYITPDYTKEF